MVYAHPGIGYVGHLAQELLLRRTGLRMTPVPYRSGAEVVRSLLAERDPAVHHHRLHQPALHPRRQAEGAGRRRRQPRAAAARGADPGGGARGALAGFEATVWHGILAPAGLPEALTTAANRVFNAVMRQPEVVRVIEQTQAGRSSAARRTQFAAFIRPSMPAGRR